MYGINLSASIKKVPSSRSHITLFTHPDPMWCAELHKLNYVMFSSCHGNVLLVYQHITAAKDSYREQEILSPYTVHLKITAMHGYVEYPQQQTATGRECQHLLSCEQETGTNFLTDQIAVINISMRVIQVILRKEK